MFRKVQLKFFGIITSILLAIFIAVLGSVNIIMDTVMENQTRIVLEQVAAGVGYDGVSQKFFIERPDDKNWQRFDDYQRAEPPADPDIMPSIPTTVQTEGTTSEAQTSEEITTTSEVLTAAETLPPQTTAPTEAHIVEPQTTRAPETQPTWEKATRATAYKVPTTTEAQRTHPPHTQPPQTQPSQTQPPQTQPPQTLPPQTQPPETTARQDHNGDQPVWGPWGPWGPWTPWGPPPWLNGGGDGDINDGHNYGSSDDDDDDDRCQENKNCPMPQGAVYGMANTSFAPVLDGYTIINASDSAATVTTAADTTTAPPVPREPMRRRDDGYDNNAVPRSLGSIDFFIIMADEEGKLAGIQNNDEMSDAVAQEYINEILSRNVSSGMANNYQFCTEKKDNGTLMVFTDKSAEIDMMNKLKRTTVIVGLISIVILSAAAYFLSGLIVRPIKVAFDKQKQFISDASHELKTPLTVISANADVLEGEIGENKWLTYIQDQADRMNVLVNDLLNLTRLENNSNFIPTEFDLSKAIENTALPFECRAFEAGKNFVLNIQEGLRITGSEQHVKQMAAIFIDNALKYSKENGTVRVTLKNDGGKIRFSVYNTGTGLKEEEKEKIFERFYRSDASRNRATGGYGLGLAIAKSIIDKHKFKLFVDNAEGKSVCFIVTMN
ncbi:His Kinase A (phospho-acceptor) domain-containing protein [Ruminococcus sp. YRD2003]|uniref:ATP-binding protein n=1 Tax=Ruminococcus sp. YRD2003 TaxID=1452313 RepID=UPI0008B1628C|nr:His Kinase A (phospho-acceptor) domain-containing protein [Ruminococcus flavefaciens]